MRSMAQFSRKGHGEDGIAHVRALVDLELGSWVTGAGVPPCDSRYSVVTASVRFRVHRKRHCTNWCSMSQNARSWNASWTVADGSLGGRGVLDEASLLGASGRLDGVDT